MTRWRWVRGCRYVRPDEFHDQPGRVAGGGRVGLAVEIAGREIFGSVEGQFPIAPQFARRGCQPRDLQPERLRDAVALGLDHVRHIVDAGRFDANGTQQPLQREFDHFLRFADHIGPAFGLEQHVQRAQPRLRAPQMIGCEIPVSHQAASVQ